MEKSVLGRTLPQGVGRDAPESWGQAPQPHHVSGAAVSGNSGDRGLRSCVSASRSAAEVLRAMREADSFQLQMEGVSSQQVGAQSVEGGEQQGSPSSRSVLEGGPVPPPQARGQGHSEKTVCPYLNSDPLTSKTPVVKQGTQERVHHEPLKWGGSGRHPSLGAPVTLLPMRPEAGSIALLRR